MRVLDRPEEPQELIDARNNYHGTPGPTEAWEQFGKTGGRTIVREDLEIVQDELCAYCENSLENYGHIDHFEPKSRRWQLTFDWENLIVSCSHNDSCGGKKGKRFDIDWLNPYEEDPLDWFDFYSTTGEIKPENGPNSARAQKMITDFGLDCERLNRKRESILKAWKNNINALLDQPDALESFIQFADIPFPTARNQISQNLLEE